MTRLIIAGGFVVLAGILWLASGDKTCLLYTSPSPRDS